MRETIGARQPRWG